MTFQIQQIEGMQKRTEPKCRIKIIGEKPCKNEHGKWSLSGWTFDCTYSTAGGIVYNTTLDTALVAGYTFEELLEIWNKSQTKTEELE